MPGRQVEENTNMRVLTSWSVILLLLAGCAGRGESGAAEQAGSRSGVEFYGTLDVGVGHQSHSR